MVSVPGGGVITGDLQQFREWRGSYGGADKAILFCSGDPGVGKSYLR